MPCYDAPDRKGDIQYLLQKPSSEIHRYQIGNYIEALEDRRNLLAQLLCYVMNGMSPESREQAMKENYELACWWEHHDKFDKERCLEGKK